MTVIARAPVFVEFMFQADVVDHVALDANVGLDRPEFGIDDGGVGNDSVQGQRGRNTGRRRVEEVVQVPVPIVLARQRVGEDPLVKNRRGQRSATRRRRFCRRFPPRRRSR